MQLSGYNVRIIYKDVQGDIWKVHSVSYEFLSIFFAAEFVLFIVYG